VKVSAIIVTRGDVDCDTIVNSLPPEWETILWDNGAKVVSRWPTPSKLIEVDCEDLSVYGRYAAIKYASHDLIYVQDDDCIVSDPQALVEAWHAQAKHIQKTLFKMVRPWGQDRIHVVCNMPPEFRHDFYAEHALVGFGAVFHRDAPARAFDRFWRTGLEGMGRWGALPSDSPFYRTCDIVFTALTPRVLVDVPKTNLWWAEDETRMYRQPTHAEERARMLELVRKVRDA
jgi:hypothetical protein